MTFQHDLPFRRRIINYHREDALKFGKKHFDVVQKLKYNEFKDYAEYVKFCKNLNAVYYGSICFENYKETFEQ